MYVRSSCFTRGKRYETICETYKNYGKVKREKVGHITREEVKLRKLTAFKTKNNKFCTTGGPVLLVKKLQNLIKKYKIINIDRSKLI